MLPTLTCYLVSCDWWCFTFQSVLPYFFFFVPVTDKSIVAFKTVWRLEDWYLLTRSDSTLFFIFWDICCWHFRTLSINLYNRSFMVLIIGTLQLTLLQSLSEKLKHVHNNSLRHQMPKFVFCQNSCNCCSASCFSMLKVLPQPLALSWISWCRGSWSITCFLYGM